MLTLGLVVARAPARRRPADEAERLRVREALRAIARREVLRWLVLLELSDLMLDVFVGFLALYLVDEAGASSATAGLAVAVSAARRARGLGGDDPAAARIDGLRYLGVSAVAAARCSSRSCSCRAPRRSSRSLAALALVTAGWYPVLQARLYGALDGASGLVLTAGALFPLNAVLPLAIAALAERWGLAVALWPLCRARGAAPARPAAEAPLAGRGSGRAPTRWVGPAPPCDATVRAATVTASQQLREFDERSSAVQRGSRFSRNAATPSRPSW